MSAPYVKVSGSWRIAKSAWTKIDEKWKNWFLQGGIPDARLGDPGANNTVNAIAIQSDGKIVIGGTFTTFNGITVNGIARLNADGTLETAFTANTGTGVGQFSSIEIIKIQSDGKILLGGSFSTFNSVAALRTARLNTDGTLDTVFTANVGSSVNFQLSSLAIQTDGKILVGGGFTTFNNQPRRNFVVLSPEGVDQTEAYFYENFGATSGSFNAIAIQSDGKIVIGGTFTTFNEITVNRIIRLNADGTLDTAFRTNTGTGATGGSTPAINRIVIQSDGKIIIGGTFTTFNGITTARRLVRLNTDGTLDTAFSTNLAIGPGSDVRSLAIQSDGKIIVVGAFTSFNGATRNRIIRLNTDGTPDTAFNTNTGTAANNTVIAIAIQSDGKIVIGGDFTTFNGTTVNRIARLNSDGTRDTDFTTNTGTGVSNPITTITIQSDDKILIGGSFTAFNLAGASRFARLNADGTLDTAFMSNSQLSSNANTVNAIAIQSDGKIVIGGIFISFNSTTTNRIARFNADGNRDTTFFTNIGTAANDAVSSLAIQTDGKILVGGGFTTFNNQPANRILKLESTGLKDSNFVGFKGFNSVVNTTVTQSDGKLLVGGSFTAFNGITVNGIARLNEDRTPDTDFTANIAGTGLTGGNSTVVDIAIQPDGKIIIIGSFSAFNGISAPNIVRLNSNGTIDTIFMVNIGTGANSTVSKIAIQLDEKILVSGLFTTFNGVTVNYLVRLNADGMLDTAFLSNMGTGIGFDRTITSIAIQPDKKILLSGNFTSFNGQDNSRLVRIGGDFAS
jgi:uncharacterized delta-60 repeat protein